MEAGYAIQLLLPIVAILHERGEDKSRPKALTFSLVRLPDPSKNFRLFPDLVW